MQDDRELAALIAALTPEEQKQLEAALGGSLPTQPEPYREPQGFMETLGQMATGESEGLGAQGRAGLTGLGMSAAVLAPGAVAGSFPNAVWAAPATVGGAVTIEELIRGKSPWWAAAEGGLAAAGARGIGAIYSRVRELRNARRAAAALERIGPTAEEAARGEALVTRGTAPASARPRMTASAEPSGVRNPPYRAPTTAPSVAEAEPEAALLPTSPGSRIVFRRATEPSGVRNRPYTPPPAQTEVESVSVGSTPPPPTTPPTAAGAKPPSRLGTPQTGTAARTGPTIEQARMAGKQANIVITNVHKMLAEGATPAEAVQTLVNLGIRPDVAKALIDTAMKGVVPAAVLDFAAGAKERERNRKAQQALRRQAEGVIP